MVPSGSKEPLLTSALAEQVPGAVFVVTSLQTASGGWLIGGISNIPALEKVTCSHWGTVASRVT